MSIITRGLGNNSRIITQGYGCSAYVKEWKKRKKEHKIYACPICENWGFLGSDFYFRKDMNNPEILEIVCCNCYTVITKIKVELDG